jgi:hypothetical protein
MKRWCWVAVTCFSLFPSIAAAQTGSEGFEKLKTLTGDWEGSFRWTGARNGFGSVQAKYYMTGMGSAIVEDLTMNSSLAMTSVYHLDGTDLRMTHYCAARNQPRLKARRIDVVNGVLDFDFVDATNLSSPDKPHVNGVEIRWITVDRITIRFLFDAGAAHSQELLDLKRIKQDAH